MRTKSFQINNIVLFSILLTIIGSSAWWAVSTYRQALYVQPGVQVENVVKPRNLVDFVQILEIKDLDQIQPGLQSYWMVESEGNFRVVNRSDEELLVTLSVATLANPCGEINPIKVVWPGGSGQTLVEAGKMLQVKLVLEPQLSNTVHLATSSDPCVIASDTRVFFSGVDVQISQVAEQKN
jgi:hypothetical protein